MPFYGGGGGWRIGWGCARAAYSTRNGGCAACAEPAVAKQLLSSGELKTALIAIAQNAEASVSTNHGAAKPGVGARRRGRGGAGDAFGQVADPRCRCRTYGEYAGDMTTAVDPQRKWWQPGPANCISGSRKQNHQGPRGNRQVPEVAYAVCDRVGMQPKDLDLLVTNQPNRVFLRNWRDALELPKERHVDTFEDCGNLFAAGIPVNLDRAISDGTLEKGDVVMMAAFAHAGDFAGAAAIKWGGRD
jgi:3-oxoacyl-[acyl-carrier-protein] synthase-3